MPKTNTVGDENMLQLLFQNYNPDENALKIIRAMEIPGVGCMVQVTTRQNSRDGIRVVTETSTFIPGVTIVEDVNRGHKLVAAWSIAGTDE